MKWVLNIRDILKFGKQNRETVEDKSSGNVGEFVRKILSAKSVLRSSTSRARDPTGREPSAKEGSIHGSRLDAKCAGPKSAKVGIKDLSCGGQGVLSKSEDQLQEPREKQVQSRDDAKASKDSTEGGSLVD